MQVFALRGACLLFGATLTRLRGCQVSFLTGCRAPLPFESNSQRSLEHAVGCGDIFCVPATARQVSLHDAL